MKHFKTPIGGRYYRVVHPLWKDPTDASYAAVNGQRWNPSGVECLYLNHDRTTATANAARMRRGKRPYGPTDVKTTVTPDLATIEIPFGRALDVFSGKGLDAAGLPATYPLDQAGETISHGLCQQIGLRAFEEGLDGIDCRSAIENGNRELAWFPRERTAVLKNRQSFAEWWQEE